MHMTLYLSIYHIQYIHASASVVRSEIVTTNYCIMGIIRRVSN